MEYKQVVTSFLQADQKILILRRSSKVGTYQRRWAAVSGYLERNEEPFQRALTEIHEEVGLTSEQIALVRSGEVLRVFDEQANIVWIIHPFLFSLNEQSIRLDWEHSEYKWIDPTDLSSYETVPKLKEAFDRVRWDLQVGVASLATVLDRANAVAQDRVHGASLLGRQSLEILKDTVAFSDANSPDDLFRDLLIVAFKLREAQPSMASLRNLLGKLLYGIDLRRKTSSLKEFRELLVSLAEKALRDAEKAAEQTSWNSAAVLPERGRVLTHSYSGTVKRTFEFARQDGKKLQVYVTESKPGFEGRQLAKDLSNVGVETELIADSSTTAVMSNVDLVLVGADSVLADGSVINKVGTRDIALATQAHKIPFYVVSETAKFSVSHFLGEQVGFREIFDKTPKECVSRIITEKGSIRSEEVEHQIRIMLRELYT